jgi:hypothetical protein
VYHDRLKRYDPPLIETLRLLSKEMNVAPAEDDEFWGEWIEEIVRTDQDTPYLDYFYMVPY